MFYRYKNVDLYLRGIRDFLKGPEWLMKQDGEALHQSVMAAGYKAQELEQLDMAFNYPVYQESYEYVDNKKSKIKRRLTFNGLFLRAKGTNIIPMAAARPVHFYRKKRVMQYDVTSKKAFITEKSVGASLKYMGKVFGLICVLPFRLKKAQQAYRTEGMRLRTLAFWNEFLGLDS